MKIFQQISNSLCHDGTILQSYTTTHSHISLVTIFHLLNANLFKNEGVANVVTVFVLTIKCQM